MTTSRKFGLDFVGDVPWGTHLCQFYETKHDLIDILVPYFAEGLRSKEACVWVTSEPINEEEAAAALEKVVPDIFQFIEKRQLFILPYTEVHMKGGTFDADRVMQWWLEKEEEALYRGFEGLRLAGNTFWIERHLWDAFTDYEETVNNSLEGHRIIAVCPYSLERCSGSDVTDVIRNHEGTIIKKGANWSVVEDVIHRKEAEIALQRAHDELEQKVEDRTRKLQNEIEERIEAETKLAESEQKYRNLVEDANSIILELDTIGTITFINEYGLQFFGYAAGELIGRNLMGTIVPEVESTGRDLRLLIEDLLSTPDHYQKNVNENVTKNGQRVWVSWSNRAITDSDGRIIGNRAIGNDITALKNAEAEIVRRNEMLDLAYDAVIIRDMNDRITYWNKGAERLYGWKEGVVRDKVTHELFQTVFPEPLDVIMQSLHQDGDWEGELIHTTADSALIVVESRWTLYRDNDGKPLAIFEINKDVTERKQAEESLQQAHDELEQKVKERTIELQNEVEEHKMTEEELRSTSEELQDNVEELRRAEQSVQEHARMVDILNRVIRAGNEADELQMMLSSMLDTAVELMGFDGGTIYSLNEAQHNIELQCQRGYPPEFVKRQLQHVSLTQKNIARIYKGEPLFSEDYVSDAVEGFNPGDIIARAAIPLIARGSAIGHYTLFSRRPHRFTPEERELLVTLGREAATVIAKVQAEEEIKQQLRLIDLASEAIIIRDLDHHALSWNRGAEKIFGWTKDEAIGQHMPTLLQTEFPVSFDKAQDVLLSDGHWEAEMWCTTKNGARIAVEHRWTLERDDAGNPSTMLTIINDITERKKAEEQLLAMSRYSRNLIETSLDPLVTISAEGKITDVNKATEKVTGFSREELIGSDFSNYFTKSGKAREGYQKVFKEGFVRDYPLAVRHISGKITEVLYNAAVYRNEAGEIQGVFAVARDITERKKAQEALKRAHDELEQIVQKRTRDLQEEIEEHKMTEEELRSTAEELRELTDELTRSNKELEQFAYIASHDLQEPLRTVTSAIGLFEKGYKDKLGEDADMFITYAVNGAKQMQQLIKDLLAYSRVTSRGEAFKPVHCEGVVQHAIDNLQIAIEESGAKIEMPAQPLPMVMGDKTQLIQLFQNLIGNAIKFRDERPPEVQIDAELDGGGNTWQFSVRDNGIGMDMQYGDKIFTIFERLHTTEQYPGTGLGLALCKKIIERHNGKIWVDSKLGIGSTFYFTLPFYVE